MDRQDRTASLPVDQEKQRSEPSRHSTDRPVPYDQAFTGGQSQCHTWPSIGGTEENGLRFGIQGEHHVVPSPSSDELGRPTVKLSQLLNPRWPRRQGPKNVGYEQGRQSSPAGVNERRFTTSD